MLKTVGGIVLGVLVGLAIWELALKKLVKKDSYEMFEEAV